MEVIYPCCCGLDVHKKSITACVLWAEAKGKSRKQKKRFGTFTHDLLQLADWLGQCGVTHVAMESTGVYWKPVWNILAEQFEALLLNAQHIERRTRPMSIRSKWICAEFVVVLLAFYDRRSAKNPIQQSDGDLSLACRAGSACREHFPFPAEPAPERSVGSSNHCGNATAHACGNSVRWPSGASGPSFSRFPAPHHNFFSRLPGLPGKSRWLDEAGEHTRTKRRPRTLGQP
jgi:hypothetical protein